MRFLYPRSPIFINAADSCLVCLLMILGSFAFISKWYPALMSHKPAIVPSSIEAREAGVSDKPPPSPGQLAVPTPDSAEPHLVLLGLEQASSSSSDKSASSGVQIPPLMYVPH